MFLDQQLLIQRAVKVIARLPQRAKWRLEATDEDGQEYEEDENAETSATLSISVLEADLPAAMSAFPGHWEEEVVPEDGTPYYWRSEGDLEVTIEILEDESVH